jgi:hypothetical protein
MKKNIFFSPYISTADSERCPQRWTEEKPFTGATISGFTQYPQA